MHRHGTDSLPIVRSVIRAFDILDELANGPAGVLEISKKIGLPKTTVYRILTTMEQRNVVYRAAGTQKYQLGPYLVYLGHCVGSARALQEVALGPMSELRDEYGETVNLNIVVNNERVCIASLESRKSLRSVSVVGERSPLYSGAAARSILAFLPDETIEEYLATLATDSDWQRRGMSVDELREAIMEAREKGYVASRGERTVGVSSVGAPIRDREGRLVGSINVSGPSERLESRGLDELAEGVCRTSHTISLALGYDSQVPVTPVRVDFRDAGSFRG